MDELSAFAARLNGCEDFRRAAADTNVWVSICVRPAIRRAAISSFAGSGGGWHYLHIHGGRAEAGDGDRREAAAYPDRVEIEVEPEAFAQLLRGERTVGQLLLEDRLVIGGPLSHWTATLLHLGQLGSRELLPTGHRKAFLRRP